MPKVSDEHRNAQRQRIMDAAIEVIQAKGLSATTMADIIKASGLSAGAIYGYYKGKEKLLTDVASQVLTSRSEVMEAHANATPVPPPSAVIADTIRSLPREWAEGGLIMQFWGAISVHPDLTAHMLGNGRQLFAHATTYLAAWLAQEGGDPERAPQLTPGFVALIQGYIMQATFGINRDVDAYEKAVDALLRGELLPRA